MITVGPGARQGTTPPEAIFPTVPPELGAHQAKAPPEMKHLIPRVMAMAATTGYYRGGPY